MSCRMVLSLLLVLLIAVTAPFFMPLNLSLKSSDTVSCSNPSWDFGTINSMAAPSISHTFYLVNDSKHDVACKIIPSCGCISSASSAMIGAGKRFDLSVTIDLSGPPTPISRTIEITTDCTSVPKMSLLINGVVSSNASGQIHPAVIDFGDVAAVSTRIVRISRFDGSPVEFLSAESPSRAFSVLRSQSVDQAGTVIDLDVAFDPSGLKPGRLNEDLVAHTSNSQFPSIKVPVMASVLKPLESLIKSKVVHWPPGDDSVVVQISNGNCHDQIKQVFFDGDDSIRVEEIGSHQLGDPLSVAFCVTREQLRPRAFVSGTLHVTTSDEESEILLKFFFSPVIKVIDN